MYVEITLSIHLFLYKLHLTLSLPNVAKGKFDSISKFHFVKF